MHRLRLALVLASAVYLAGATCHAPAADYHFDQYRGSDDGDGATASPFKSLQKVAALPLKPGDRVRFARNSSFHGSVTIEASGTKEAPIVLTAYGKGRAPRFTNSDFADAYGSVFRIRGSHVVVDGLYLHSGPSVPPTIEGSDPVRKTGAVFVERGAEHVTIRNCEVVDYPIGFQVYGEHGLVTRNYLHDCQSRLKHPNWGPIGIMVATSHNEMSYNRIENYICTGGSFGADGEMIAAPRFVALEKHDFRPVPGSPAIDAATNLSYERDFADQKVPHGKAPDIGASEFPGTAAKDE